MLLVLNYQRGGAQIYKNKGKKIRASDKNLVYNTVQSPQSSGTLLKIKVNNWSVS